jgi:septum formation protein
MIRLKYPLILASKSPRRQHLLRDAGFEFTVETIEIEERWPDDLPISEIPVYLAKKKAEMLIPTLKNRILVSADTIVTVESRILGKPESPEEARHMLLNLSEKTHLVYSGVCLAVGNKMITFVDATEVTFIKLTMNEIDYYVHHFSPLDKAGAYGIQEWIGLIGIEKIKGSYFNVVGLPVSRLYTTLKDLDLIEF